MSEYLLICKKCKIQQEPIMFTKGKRICKTCRNRQEREHYKINEDNEKNKLREEFLKRFKKRKCWN